LADTILSIDKLKKIGREEVNKELAEKNIIGPAIEKAFDFLSISGSPSEILASYQQLLTSDISREGLKELQELFESLKAMNIPEDKITVVSSLARGLEIYTGTVFEIFAKDSPISSSLAAGGRYDKIIGSFLDSDTEIPAVGISFGLEPIYAVIVAQGIKSENDLRIFVISIQSNLYALKVIAQLRKAGIPSELDLRQKGLSKALEYANSQKFTYVVIVGKKEVESGKLTLRNMESGVEERLTIEEVVGKLRKERDLSER
ncbi:MAG TPA: His/Gly/Thr/Pro-type tRNA ligase C-terminal domain-containing protein, partial [Candidatus Hodarchaeales archaeon]|nr:His/Gly/Thr/Pro-type tRNA ligase C-terminal domain-containing protein [Candidatus Hodarchaeales archaeon]